MLINNFVLNTAVFLNSFAETVERKISSVSNKVTELEILLTVLEEKLNSVPGLEVEGAAPISSNTATTAAAPTASSSTTPSSTVPPPPAQMVAPVASTPPPGAAVPAAEIPVESSKPSLADDPDYGPFVKMIKVGVPKFVVVAKATAAGLDGALLEAFEP